MTVDQARRRKALVRWHRRAAIVVLAWLVLLAVSGVLINHAHDWGLDKTALPALLQKGVYGVETRGGHYCSSHPELGEACSGIFARLTLPEGALLLAEHSVFLLDSAGNLVEQLAVAQLGLSGLQGGLSWQGRIYLRDREIMVSAGPDLLDFVELKSGDVAAIGKQGWATRADGDAISWERLLLDVHAARFLGPLSKLFNDLAAALILFLAVTGFWLYLHKRKGTRGGAAGDPPTSVG